MSPELQLLEIRNRKEWRRWLEARHRTSPGVWLVFHRNHTGVECVAYEDSVRDALCFGWIDSLVKRLDDDRYARKFTPRTPASKWSDLNRRRWTELREAGLLAPAGLAAAPTANTYAPLPKIPELPGYIADAFKANAEAWSFFRALPPSERRRFVGWVHMAKRPETREKRLRESIRLLAAKQKLGLK